SNSSSFTGFCLVWEGVIVDDLRIGVERPFVAGLRPTTERDDYLGRGPSCIWDESATQTSHPRTP
ncbi:hypothetical protein, partial [Paraburkholderia tropica]|uniref:hypothetical protein n=1 Tax=Paraburkholderia tropica TaxID=92647 RepID=UPI001ABF6A2F